MLSEFLHKNRSDCLPEIFCGAVVFVPVFWSECGKGVETSYKGNSYAV